MSWINPLDKVPQVPTDWANHVIYGGALGLAVQAAHQSAGVALGAVLAVAATKKAVDYFRQGQSLGLCVAKTVVTAAVPLSYLALDQWLRL